MTRHVLSLVLLAALVGAAPAPAQTPAAEESAILAVVDRFMHAVTNGDSAAMASIRLEGSTTTIERPDPGGGTQVLRRPFTPGGGSSSAPAAGAQRERYWDPVVHVRGSLAVVWTPYEFWRDAKTTHCGVDVFEMVKQDGAWKIGHVMYTVEPNACPAMRPKDAARVRPTPSDQAMRVTLDLPPELVDEAALFSDSSRQRTPCSLSGNGFGVSASRASSSS